MSKTTKDFYEEWRPAYLAVLKKRAAIQKDIDELLELKQELSRINAEIDTFLSTKAPEYRHNYDSRRTDEEMREASCTVKYRLLPAHKAVTLI